jgi:ABC-type uncharacterized transport system substrate-binding protein
MANTDDPVRSGLVASLSHPGGNVTGLSSYNGLLAPTKFEMVINLKTTQALGLKLPESVPARATEIVQ